MTGAGRSAAIVLGLVVAWSAAAEAEEAHAEAAQYSAATLYNLGNAYARSGKPGLAVLNYERASLLAPDDPDIEANLRTVRDSLHLPMDAASGFTRAATRLRPTLVAWLGLTGLLLLGGSLLAGRSEPRLRWRRRGAAFVGLTLIGATLGNAVALWPTLHAAVVIAASAPVRASPVPMGEPLFTLTEADTVRVAAEREDFLLVQTRAGRRGWVSRADIVAVRR